MLKTVDYTVFDEVPPYIGIFGTMSGIHLSIRAWYDVSKIIRKLTFFKSWIFNYAKK
jgi:hypothetical protein